MAPILMRFLPSVDDMDSVAAERGKKLGIIRAFTAFSVDWIVCNVINLGVNYVAYHFFEKYIFSDVLQVQLFKLLILAGYFIWLPRHWKKQTIGNALVKVKIVSDADKERKVTGRELLYRNLLLYFAEPMMIFISAILVINTAISYMASDATNFQRTVLTVACIVYFPIFLAVLLNSVAKKGGLPHNTWTKTHLELEEKHEE